MKILLKNSLFLVCTMIGLQPLHALESQLDARLITGHTSVTKYRIHIPRSLGIKHSTLLATIRTGPTISYCKCLALDGRTKLFVKQFCTVATLNLRDSHGRYIEVDLDNLQKGAKKLQRKGLPDSVYKTIETLLQNERKKYQTRYQEMKPAYLCKFPLKLTEPLAKLQKKF